jgi:hypothetical protein
MKVEKENRLLYYNINLGILLGHFCALNKIVGALLGHFL